MANPYFSYVPNFEYVSRLSDALISDYVEVKNLFKRLKVPEDIFGDLTNFTKYQIEGDERPDQVAFKLYQDQYLDWLILLSNNVIYFEHEWPLNQQSFYIYLLSKYKTEDYQGAIEDKRKAKNIRLYEIEKFSGLCIELIDY